MEPGGIRFPGGISDPAATDYVAVEPIYEPEAAVGAATPIERELDE